MIAFATSGGTEFRLGQCTKTKKTHSEPITEFETTFQIEYLTVFSVQKKKIVRNAKKSSIEKLGRKGRVCVKFVIFYRANFDFFKFSQINDTLPGWQERNFIIDIRRLGRIKSKKNSREGGRSNRVILLLVRNNQRLKVRFRKP